MSVEDEVELFEHQDRAWKVLPDALVTEIIGGKLAPEVWTSDLVGKVIRHVVARCFDLHVSQVGELVELSAKGESHE